MKWVKLIEPLIAPESLLGVGAGGEGAFPKCGGKRSRLHSGGCLLPISEIKSKKQRAILAFPPQRGWPFPVGRGSRKTVGRGPHGHAQCELHVEGGPSCHLVMVVVSVLSHHQLVRLAVV